MPEDEVIWEIEEHTKAKHRILRRYLEAWLPIMSKYNSRIVYIDGFAGPGVYKGGEPGSPIIALALFQPEPDTRLLREALRRHFGARPFAIEEAERFTLVETPYLRTHIRRRTLDPMEEAGELEVLAARPGRRRGNYPPGTRMRFLP